MKRITKKLCSSVCALLAFSGSRGGALVKEALYFTKEISCNAIQYFECLFGYSEYKDSLSFSNITMKNGTYVKEPVTSGQKFYAYAMGAATIANAVDAAKRSCDILKRSYDVVRDVIKGTKSKLDTTDNKESTNYWPILEAIFGVSQFAHAFGHGLVFDGYKKIPMIIGSILGSISLTDAYFRFRENNQNSGSPIQNKEEATQKNLISPNPENPKDSSSDKK